MSKCSCKIRINKTVLKSYTKAILDNPDILVIVSVFVVLLATDQIWNKNNIVKYDLHRLNGNFNNIYDVHLPINQDLIVLFQCNLPLNPTEVKINILGIMVSLSKIKGVDLN